MTVYQSVASISKTNNGFGHDERDIKPSITFPCCTSLNANDLYDESIFIPAYNSSSPAAAVAAAAAAASTTDHLLLRTTSLGNASSTFLTTRPRRRR